MNIFKKINRWKNHLDKTRKRIIAISFTLFLFVIFGQMSADSVPPVRGETANIFDFEYTAGYWIVFIIISFIFNYWLHSD